MPCAATLMNQRPAAQRSGFSILTNYFAASHPCRSEIKEKQTNLCDAGVAILRVAAWAISYPPPHPLEAARIVAISGGSMIGYDYYLRVAKSLGAYEVVAKPFDLDEFVGIVQRCLPDTPAAGTS